MASGRAPGLAWCDEWRVAEIGSIGTAAEAAARDKKPCLGWRLGIKCVLFYFYETILSE